MLNHPFVTYLQSLAQREDRGRWPPAARIGAATRHGARMYPYGPGARIRPRLMQLLHLARSMADPCRRPGQLGASFRRAQATRRTRHRAALYRLWPPIRRIWPIIYVQAVSSQIQETP